MKIFGFFYSEKIIFHKNKKNSIIVQQEKELAIYTTRDDNGRIFGTRQSHPDPVYLFFSILQLVSFKKLNKAGRRWENSQTRIVYILFLFLFLNFNFFIFVFYFYYIKISIFHNNKNIMNFYKLFIKKHYNNNYYLY